MKQGGHAFNLADMLSRFERRYSFTELLNSRVAMVREKYLEKELFFRSGKSQGIFVDGQGN